MATSDGPARMQMMTRYWRTPQRWYFVGDTTCVCQARGYWNWCCVGDTMCGCLVLVPCSWRCVGHWWRCTVHSREGAACSVIGASAALVAASCSKTEAGAVMSKLVFGAECSITGDGAALGLHGCPRRRKRAETSCASWTSMVGWTAWYPAENSLGLSPAALASTRHASQTVESVRCSRLLDCRFA